jgi:hypothetical protein
MKRHTIILFAIEVSKMKKVISLALTILFFVTGLAFAAQREKIAVASDEKSITGSVGFRTGQSSFYLLFDGNGKFIEAVDNPFKDAGANAWKRSGKSAIDSLRFDEKGGLTGEIKTLSKNEREGIWNPMIEFLKSKGITVVVAEQFGNEIIQAMKEKGITCVEFKGQTVDAAKKVRNRQKSNRRDLLK